MDFMARRTIIAVALLVVPFLCSIATAARLDYYLKIDNVSHTWELAASTDSPGGIGAIVVNIRTPGGGWCVAPRALKGFTLYDDWLGPSYLPMGKQAFAAQVPIDITSIVYGIGYIPVLDSEFALVPGFEMYGTAETVPTVFYRGWYLPMEGTPSFHSKQENAPGSVYIAPPPPGGYDKPVIPSDITLVPQIVTYTTYVVPEPASWVIALTCVPWIIGRAKRSLP